MTDKELTLAMAELQEVVRCRCDEAYRDRGLKDPQCECDSAEAVKVVADRIEALTEQLAAAQQDAKEAEAYAEELEQRLSICERHRDAYAECDRIGTQAVRDLEAKLSKTEGLLAKAVEALELIVVDNTWGLEHETYMKCRATLAEIKGESHE
ncbi:hypothetical protein UFOVP845_49 [uncultured Caudovirales phage]|uniref:Uncharacterized protein n=1 Tax=uncultured Caudovirales phage TaxID=2100421 RepID=A0A6J5P6N9_9CAUD|nr:hypothetical protein UFOVP845_49 [uncultured Caudovirales phage]